MFTLKVNAETLAQIIAVIGNTSATVMGNLRFIKVSGEQLAAIRAAGIKI